MNFMPVNSFYIFWNIGFGYINDFSATFALEVSVWFIAQIESGFAGKNIQFVYNSVRGESFNSIINSCFGQSWNFSN